MGKTLRQASFPRTPTGASVARRLVANALRGWMSEQERLDFALAIGEAISNAVRHGGGDKFAVSCWSRDGKIIVDVIDEGTGFPRKLLEPPIDDGNGGYGLLIIRKLTDELHLLEGGRRVRLVKRLVEVPAIPFRTG
jgi:serine/threonine-protein kinase RsbW